MKSRQLLIPLAIFILVVAAVVGSFLTREQGSFNVASGKQSNDQPTPLVDESPLLTARAMAKLASNPDEKQLASQISDTADDEVDMAFRDASRYAADHPALAKPENKELYEHASQSEAQVQADLEDVSDAKKQLASAKIAQQDAAQEQLDIAQAQLELDQDELNDAKEDLLRAGADPGSLIQHQFAEHQAAEHNSDNKTSANNDANASINYQSRNLYAQYSAFRALAEKDKQLQKASDEAKQKATQLKRDHDALTKEIAANKPATNASGASTVSQLHLLSDDNKNLADYDKRMQDSQDLETGYKNWIGLIHRNRMLAIHEMFQSALWILLIVMATYLADDLIGRYLQSLGSERTRLHTLRVVIRFASQVVAVLLIAFVIFGAPSQTPTVLGLAGAGLTVAMKDFIVAFFGWFVLMGRNGMRVGDWVEINGVAGEVVEINLLRTVVLETGNWTDTGHPTGRKVAFVNSFAIEGHFFNFSTVGQWLWDELQIVVPSSQNPYPIIDSIQKIVTEETAKNARAAEQEWAKATTRYQVNAVSAAPAVNLRPTASGIEVHVRYITRANERYATRTHLYQSIVGLLHGGEIPVPVAATPPESAGATVTQVAPEK